jgi:hypothetical protein
MAKISKTELEILFREGSHGPSAGRIVASLDKLTKKADSKPEKPVKKETKK